MLAQNFLDATALEISPERRDALVTVLYALETGEITDAQFVMGDWWNECSTTGCLAGWSDYLAKHRVGYQPFCNVHDSSGAFPDYNDEELWPRNLDDLFSANLNGGNYGLDDVTRTQAAQALRNYLTTGKPDWNNIMNSRVEQSG